MIYDTCYPLKELLNKTLLWKILCQPPPVEHRNNLFVVQKNKVLMTYPSSLHQAFSSDRGNEPTCYQPAELKHLQPLTYIKFTGVIFPALQINTNPSM